MAEFNPPVQQTPDYPYINWARPTSEPKPDTSKGILLEGLSKAGGEGVRGVNDAIEKGIQNDIYAQVDPVRDEYMAQLYSVDKQLRPGDQPANPLGKGNPMDIRSLPDQIDRFNSARANGKISQTDYDARLNSLAKEVRAKYPGYREYVDETFKRATGRDSANQYIRSVIGDLDSYMQARKGASDKILDKAMGSALKYPGGARWIQLLQGNPGDPKIQNGFLNWMNQQESTDAMDERAEREHRLGVQDKEESASRTINDHVQTVVSGHWDTMFAGTGMADADRMQEILNKERRGQPVTDADEATLQRMAIIMQQERGAYKSEAVNRFSNQYGPGGRSIVDDAGGAVKAEEQAEAAMKLYYDPIMQAFQNKEFGLANSIQTMNRARANDMYNKVISDKQYQNYLLLIQAMHQNNPPLANSIGQSMLTMPDKIAAQYGVAAPAIASDDPTKKSTLKETVEQAKARNIREGKFYSSISDFVTMPANKEVSDEYAKSIISNSFSPENYGLLAHFDRDKYSMARGGGPKQFIPGQETLFRRFTSEGMVDRAWQLSNGKHSADPDLWTRFRGWAENDGKYIFERDAKTSATNAYLGPIGYDTDHNTFTVPTKSPVASGAGKPGSVSRSDISGYINHLNNTMEGLRNIWRKEGLDPTEAEYVFLQSTNPEPNSLVDRMLKAIETTHASRNK